LQKKVSAILIAIFVCALLVVTPVKAQFIVASWEYPDEYGQGISTIMLYEDGDLEGFCNYNNASNEFIISEGDNITLRVTTYINQTVVGVGTVEAGKAYIRHSIVISTPSNSSFFSQQNFTYYSGALVPPTNRIVYTYTVWLNVVWVAGTTYTATITFEVFY
jgi:hypothetical protein